MHGSLLALSLFLPPKAILLEFFPYAIPPENYTPYRTVANLLQLIYVSWANQDPSRSVPHPDRPANQGGIAYLPLVEKETIEHSERVKPHLCCDHPQWLYRIYQDTKVNVEEIRNLLKDAIQKSINLRFVKSVFN